MPALVAGIHVFLRHQDKQDVDGWDKRAFTPVFDGLCLAMTDNAARNQIAKWLQFLSFPLPLWERVARTAGSSRVRGVLIQQK
jgi:hypothetical protein